MTILVCPLSPSSLHSSSVFSILEQLPGRLQTLLRLKQEKEELAKLKDTDPLKTLDPDEASRRRLLEMREAAAAAKKPTTKAVIPDDDEDVDDRDKAPAAKVWGCQRYGESN